MNPCLTSAIATSFDIPHRSAGRRPSLSWQIDGNHRPAASQACIFSRNIPRNQKTRRRCPRFALHAHCAPAWHDSTRWPVLPASKRKRQHPSGRRGRVPRTGIRAAATRWVVVRVVAIGRTGSGRSRIGGSDLRLLLAQIAPQPSDLGLLVVGRLSLITQRLDERLVIRKPSHIGSSEIQIRTERGSDWPIRSDPALRLTDLPSTALLSAPAPA